MMYLRLAWRNIWRNHRRTLITASSVFFAVLLAVVMRSLQNGVYDNMIRNAVGMYLGYVQIHQKGYWEDKSLNNSFAPDSALRNVIEKNNKITASVPRLESFALASSGDETKTVLVIGTDPEKEAQFTGLDNRVTKGNYFSSHENAALLAEDLAKRLNLTVKDTLVLLGQGYHGRMAAGKYVVEGILHFGSPDQNRTMIYLPLTTAQQFYGTGDRLTSLALNLRHSRDLENVADFLKSNLNSKDWEVMDWKEMMPQLIQIIQVDSAGGMIMIGILYLVIVFGVFGTSLMMLAERKHELGVLMAIGMKPYIMGWMIFSELILMMVLGVVAGIVIAVPLVNYLKLHPIHMTGKAAQAYINFGLEPIFPFSTSPDIFISQGVIVLVIGMLLSLYAWYRILNIRAVENLKN